MATGNDRWEEERGLIAVQRRIGMGLVGTALMLGGLVWDAAAHSHDPTLAERESVIDPSNPSHLLLYLGAGIVVGSLISAFWTTLTGPTSSGRMLARAGFVAATVVTVTGMGGGLVWATNLHPENAADSHSSAQGLTSEKAAAVARDGVDGHGPGIVNSHAEGPCQPSDEDQAGAQRLIDDTTAGTSRLASLDAALAEGYATSNNPPLPTEHYYNPTYAADGKVLDAEHPEILVYTSTSRGPVLAGAMYLTNVPGEFGPEVGGCLTAWHVHANLCFSSTDGQFVTETDAAGACPAGTTRIIPPPALHVWLTDVPGGRFATNASHDVLLERLGQ